METKLVDTLLREWEGLQSDRAQFDSLWEDIARVMLPSRDFYKQWVQGSRRNYRIFDTTGLEACQNLASNLHSMLTSPTIKWFALKPDRPVSEDGKLWIDDVSASMYGQFNSEKGKFNTSVFEFYQDLAAFGNGVMFEQYNAKGRRVQFKYYPLADCWFAENDEGVVDVLYRRTWMTAYQCLTLFGYDNLSKSTQEKLDKTPFATVGIIHVVKPRELKTYGVTKKTKPFMSCYIEIDSKHILDEGGYDSFPYQVARFSKRSGETYGVGPGVNALPAVRMLQRIAEVTIRGAEKIVDPPLLVPNDSVIGPLVINPGGRINYDPQSEPVTPLNVASRPDVGFDLINYYGEMVKKAFYVDWMTQPPKRKGDQMTATEFIGRRDERLQQMSPMLARMNSEFTGPLIDRVFSIQWNNGMLEAPPPDIRDIDMKIEYLSPIAQAQKYQEMDAIQRSINFAAQFIEFEPRLMQNFNLDEITRYQAQEINYMPQKLLNSIETVTATRDAEAKAAQAQQQAALDEQNSKSVKNVANAQKFAVQAEAGA